MSEDFAHLDSAGKNLSLLSVPMPESRSRVSSSHIRQLSGHLLITQDQLELLESIGQGEESKHLALTSVYSHHSK